MSSMEGSGVALLVAGLDRLAGEGLLARTGAALAEELVVLHGLVDRLAAELVRRVAVFDARGDAAVDGAASTQGWLRHRCRLYPGAARERVVSARGLRELPATRAAFAAGEIGLGHAAVIAAGLAQLGPAVVGAAEPVLLTAARAADPGSLRRWLDRLRHALTPQRVAADEQAGPDRAYLRMSRTLGGMVALDGWLNPEQGATVAAALGPLMTPAGREDRRRASRCRAEALVELARRQLDSGRLPDLGGERPHLVVTASLDTMLGAPGAAPAELDPGGAVCGQAARRIACDARVARVLLGPDSLPLDVGRTHRLVTPAQRRALRVRDGGCVFTGCDRPAGWCDAHHVRSWLDGGPTDLDNLLLLCRRHHRYVHEKSWTVGGTPGEWTFQPPQRASTKARMSSAGATVPPRPPGPPGPPGPRAVAGAAGFDPG